jgi:hypothetical protein
VSSLPYVVSRDASTVLSTMEGTRRYRRAPDTRVAMPLGCLNLGSLSHPEYHGGGLLPSPLDKTIQVVTPTLFAKPGFWGLRRLTSEEMLLAKDLSEADAEKLAQPSREGSFLRAFSFRLSCFILRGGPFLLQKQEPSLNLQDGMRK